MDKHEKIWVAALCCALISGVFAVVAAFYKAAGATIPGWLDGLMLVPIALAVLLYGIGGLILFIEE